MREHQPAEDDFLHECVEKLPKEVEQGEVRAAHYSDLLVDCPKHKLRGFAGGVEAEELDRVNDRVQDNQG
jgi:hypothetical protein